jgi:hypothetical protein
VSEPAEQKFSSFKIEAGDYLVPGNDKITLFRVCKGTEDNIAEDSETVVSTPCWEVFRWYGRLTQKEVNEKIANDVVEWDRWEFMENAPTKAEAMQATARLCPGFDDDND